MPESREAYKARTLSLRGAVRSLCVALAEHGSLLGFDASDLKAMYRHLYGQTVSVDARMEPTDIWTYYRLLFRSDSTGRSLIHGRRRIGRDHLIDARAALIALRICDNASAPQIRDQESWTAFFTQARDLVLAAVQRRAPFGISDSVGANPPQANDVLNADTLSASIESTSFERVTAREPFSVPDDSFDWSEPLPVDVPIYFFGRDRELLTIASAFRSNAKVPIVALYGVRGIGKSVLAAAYCKENRRQYAAVAWLDARTDTSIRGDLQQLAIRNDWIQPAEDQEAAVSAAMREVTASEEPYLLVFDHAPNPDVVRPYFPDKGSSRLLVTSTWDAWLQIAHPIEVMPWSSEIGAQFLVTRAVRAPQQVDAETIARELKGHPLALEQAAAYCETTGITFEEYLRRLSEQQIEFLSEKRFAPEGYDRTLVSSVELCIRGASDAHPAVEPLLNHIALLAPAPVPVYLVAAIQSEIDLGRGVRHTLKDSTADEALKWLRTAGLLRSFYFGNAVRTTACVTLRPLVRELVAAPYATEHRDQMLVTLRNAISKVMDKLPRAQLLPHVGRIFSS